MDLGEILSFIRLRLNKDQSGRVFTPDNYNVALQAVNLEIFKLKYGLPESYRPGQRLPIQQWEVSQKITDDLRHLKVVVGGIYPALQVDLNGHAQLPSDYVHESSLRYKMVENDPNCENGIKITPVTIEVLKDAEWGTRVGSVLKSPDFKYPIALIQKDYIQFYPKKLKYVEFTYLRYPKQPVYDYIIVNDEEIYLKPGELHDGSVLPPGTQSRSVELEWPEIMHLDIANIMIGWIAENLREQLSIQMAQNRKVQGV